MSKIVTLNPAQLAPKALGDRPPPSATAYRLVTLLSNILNLLLAVMMFVLMLRADRNADMFEIIAREQAQNVISIADMTARLVLLHERTHELQRSTKAEDKQRLTAIEKEIRNLSGEIEQARRRVAQVAKPATRKPLLLPVPLSPPPTKDGLRPACGWEGNSPIYCN